MITKLLEDDLTSATTLNIICIRNFGIEYLEWEPEVVESELKKITKNIPKINLDKIQAMCTILTTEQYYTYYEPFAAITRTLNMDDPSFEHSYPIDGFQIAWSITEARLNDNDDSKFSSEVQDYIKICLKYHGVSKTPELIKDYVLPDYNDGSEDEYELELNRFVAGRLKRINDEIKQIE